MSARIEITEHDKKVFATFYEQNGWANSLGLYFDVTADGAPCLKLPFKVENLNHDSPTGSVNGGVSGTMLLDAGHMLCCLLTPDVDPSQIHVVDTQIFYVRGTRDNELTAVPRLIRRTRKLIFLEVDVFDEEGNLVVNSRQIFSLQGAETQSVDNQADISPRNLIEQGIGIHPDAGMFKNFGDRYEGMTLVGLQKHQAVLRMDNIACNLNPAGEMAPGSVITVSDFAGVAAFFFTEQKPVGGATVDLKMTFCDVIKDEGFFSIAEILENRGGLRHCRVTAYGTESMKLKAFGTMTLFCSS